MRKKNAKKRVLSGWGEEITNLLRASGNADATVVQKLGRAKSTFHKYLRAKAPEPTTVKKVNCAVASIIGIPSVEKYLTAIAADERREKGGKVSSDEIKSAIEDFTIEKELFCIYLRPGYDKYITTLLRKRWKTDEGEKNVLKLYLKMQKAMRKRLLCDIHGEQQKETRFDEIRKILEDHGIDLQPWMKPESEICIRQAQDIFRLNLWNAITEKSDDGEPILNAVKRYKMEQSIASAFLEYVNLHTIIECEKRIALMDRISCHD